MVIKAYVRTYYVAGICVGTVSCSPDLSWEEYSLFQKRKPRLREVKCLVPDHKCHLSLHGIAYIQRQKMDRQHDLQETLSAPGILLGLIQATGKVVIRNSSCFPPSVSLLSQP